MTDLGSQQVGGVLGDGDIGVVQHSNFPSGRGARQPPSNPMTDVQIEHLCVI